MLVQWIPIIVDGAKGPSLRSPCRLATALGIEFISTSHPRRSACLRKGSMATLTDPTRASQRVRTRGGSHRLSLMVGHWRR